MCGTRFHSLAQIVLLISLVLLPRYSFADAGCAYVCFVCGSNVPGHKCSGPRKPAKQAPSQNTNHYQNQQAARERQEAERRRREAERERREANWQRQQLERQRQNNVMQENSRRQSAIRNQQNINRMNMRLQANQNQAEAMGQVIDLFGNLAIDLMNRDDPPEPEPERKNEVFPVTTKEERRQAAREAREFARAEQERLRRENEPAKPLNMLANLVSPLPDESTEAESEGPRQEASGYTLKQFGPAGSEIARDTSRTLVGELVDQFKEADDIDVKKAARSGMKSTIANIADSGIRSFISKLSEESSIYWGGVYNTMFSSKTHMLPWGMRENIDAFGEEMYARDFRESMEIQ